MAITSVQSASGILSGPTTVTVSVPAGATRGNLLTVLLSVSDGATTFTCSDPAWRRAVNLGTTTNGGNTVELWYLVVDAAHAGQTSWSFGYSVSNNAFAWTVREWHSTTGWVANPVDQTASAGGLSASLATGTTPTTLPNAEVWVGGFSYRAAAQTESGLTAGWTSGLEATSTTFLTTREVYQISSAPAPASAALTSGTSVLWNGVVATFQAITVTPAPQGSLTVQHQGQDISAFVIEQNEGSLLGDRGWSNSGGGGGGNGITVESTLAQGAGVGGGGAAHGSTCTFDAWLGPVAKAIGQGTTPSGTDLVRQGTVKVYDARGTCLFNGIVAHFDDITESLNLKTTFTCHDLWMGFDRIQVNEKYVSQGDVAIIKALLTKYAPTIDQSQLPVGDNYIYPRLGAKGTLREVLQRVADGVGWMIWVDTNAAVHYASPTSAQTAPFGFSDAPDSVTTQPYNLTKYTLDDTGIVNRVYFYGGKSQSPDFTQDLRVQVNGTNKTFVLAYQPEDAADGKKHIIKNGVELAVGSVFDTSAAGKLKSAGGTSDVLINAAGAVATFDVAPTTTGLTQLDAKFRYSIPLVIVLSNQQSHTFFNQWFDARITDTSVFDVNTALQRCRALLAQQAYGLTSLSLTTDAPGIVAGQLVPVTHSLRGIHDTFLVQKVTTVPLGGGWFEYNIDLGAWNWSAVDVLVQSARILNPTDANAEEDMDIIQVQEVTSASTAATAIAHTTHASGAYFSGQAGTNSGFFTVTS